MGGVTLGDCLSCLVSSAVFARNVQTRARGSETRQPVRQSQIATNDRLGPRFRRRVQVHVHRVRVAH